MNKIKVIIQSTRKSEKLNIYLVCKKLGINEFQRLFNTDDNSFHMPIIFGAIDNKDEEFVIKYMNYTKISPNSRYGYHSIILYWLINIGINNVNTMIESLDKEMFCQDIFSLFYFDGDKNLEQNKLYNLLSFVLDNNLVSIGDKYENIKIVLYLVFRSNVNAFRYIFVNYMDNKFLNEVIFKKHIDHNIIYDIIEEKKTEILLILLEKFPEICNRKFKYGLHEDYTVIYYIIELQNDLDWHYEIELVKTQDLIKFRNEVLLFDLDNTCYTCELLCYYFNRRNNNININPPFKLIINTLLTSSICNILYDISNKLPLFLMIFSGKLPNEITTKLLDTLFMLNIFENNNKMNDSQILLKDSHGILIKYKVHMENSLLGYMCCDKNNTTTNEFIPFKYIKLYNCIIEYKSTIFKMRKLYEQI